MRKNMTPRYAAAALAGILLCASFAVADDAVPTKVFNMPRYEAGQVIMNWLKKTGYEVAAQTGEDKVVISAHGKASPWEIILRHHSPLATVVTSDDAVKGRADALWKYLASYQDGAVPARGFLPGDIPAPVKNRMESVVCIRAVVKNKPIQLSGFVVDTSGLIICTAHMLRNPTEITVMPFNGERFEGRLVKIDFRNDLALIDTSHAFAGAVALNTSKPAPGNKVRIFAIGCPGNHGGTLASGMVSGPPRLVEGHPLIHVLMEVEPGSSGSPVFDEQGDLVGVVQGRLKTDHLSGLLIPVETVITFVKER
jgi:serine protease Do